ncbi:hypothetical protein [Treponema brennaborense]|uniref:PEGA domain-containing protein n=1 Tax=Treponema brennaborense (strain DSM 12168 / CIP 105900 / DD5/3) TaxID=906968 RepID=F4LJU6_TREBD|nr:hypothetical protein [Treponema brennaborense]AEE16426.1 hypothetical protein Trebr_0990 [Treponema brennaborense DSM 12168]
MILRQIAAVCAAAFLLSPAALRASEWVLAAMPFGVSSVAAPAGGVSAETVRAVSAQIPQLILESLSDAETHVPSASELRGRELSALRAERKKLAGELSAAVKKRDALVLSERNERTLRKKLAEQDEAVRQITQKLTENAAALERVQTAPLFSAEDVSGDGASAVPAEAARTGPVQPETVVLWKRQTAELFSVSAASAQNSALNSVPDSASIEKAVDTARINGLITGSVSVIGQYVSVTAGLSLYPGNIAAGSVTESGSLSDTVLIAERIARALVPLIRNAPPVRVAFDVQPEAAAAAARISVDGSLSVSAGRAKDGVTLSAGVHTVTVESAGYKTTGFTYDFSQEAAFRTVIRLEKLEPKTVDFTLDVPLPGTFFINGLTASSDPVRIPVTSDVVLGEFVLAPPPGSEGNAAKTPPVSTFFTADVSGVRNLTDISASITAETQDLAFRIEKRRKTMYNSYSALLVSLIPSVASYGMYVDSYNGWAMGYKDEQERRMWKTVSDCSIALSVGFGINFIVQLGRYIFAANAILPKTAEIGN